MELPQALTNPFPWCIWLWVEPIIPTGVLLPSEEAGIGGRYVSGHVQGHLGVGGFGRVGSALRVPLPLEHDLYLK